MEQLEQIIVKKDQVIEGLKENLDEALTRLENADQQRGPETRSIKRQSLSGNEQIKESNERCMTLQKTIKSYESAIEKLTEKMKQQKRDQKAKDQIVEQYLQQTK